MMERFTKREYRFIYCLVQEEIERLRKSVDTKYVDREKLYEVIKECQAVRNKVAERI